jgi:hypothetical protein
MNENERAPYSADELNSAWHEIVDKYLIDNLMLKKEIQRLQVDNEDLKTKLHQAQLDLLKAEGKQTITNATAGG